MTHRLPLLFVPLLLAAEPIDFNRDVRPILSANCFACHGFDAKTRKAKLRLDVAEGAYAERDGLTPIKPGSLEHSEVWDRIISDDETLVMPPPETNKKLSAADKATLKAWIEQGATYRKHWAFEPITRPPVPAGSATHPLDRFLNERLAREKLTPQPEADRTTLLRRVAFALTGLPPTLEDQKRFLGDREPGAYERMVDRYLASPHYGEEMARHWLDVARYADTHGLHLDNERSMWLYRDWVVGAFNRNLSFDQFTIEQLAGDLLPNPTPEQLAATGFNRCNVTTSEGGSIAIEWVYRYAVDRTSTTAQTWLGLTAGCCQCHDHKYDPISQKEFYSLYAFFYSAADPGMDGNVNNTAPYVRMLTPQQQAVAQAAGKVEAEARTWLDTSAAHAAYSDPAGVMPPPQPKPIREVLVGDSFPFGTETRSSSRNAINWIADPAFGTAEGRRVIRQASSVNYTDTLTFKLRPIVVPEQAKLDVAIYVNAIDLPNQVKLGIVGGETLTWTRKDDTLVRGAEVIRPGQWNRLSIPAGDLKLKPGQKITGLTLSQQGGVAYWDAVSLSGLSTPASDPLESFLAWRKAIGTTPPPELPGALHAAIKAGPDKPLPAEQEQALRSFYLAVVARPATPDLAAAHTAWESARLARMTAEEAAPGSFIFRDLDTPRDAFVMMRGEYDKPGEKVVPDVPAVLPPLKTSAPRRNRLDLARWLVAPDNPLTARVTVNRFWQQMFGTGLVKTSYDFGSQGDPPSHPELLDWLASEFVRSGWDVKAFLKLMVTSEAFRRSSVVTPELLQRDPENRLLARGPRFRLDAEQLRDNALAVSGLLVPQLGGRGVKPYQPSNIWEPLGFGDSNTRYYLQDHGPDLYRRSIYVFIKRTAPPPFLVNFDGPNREQFCTRRDRTNTPLQALQLMNDVQHFEAARALAERMLAAAGPKEEERIDFLYRTVLGRAPQPDEARLVAAALAKQRTLFQADPKAAEQAVRVGESKPRGVAPAPETAAWTVVCNLLLNLDETVTRN